MKKFIALIIVAVALIGTICACSQNVNDVKSTVDRPSTQSSSPSNPTPPHDENSSFMNQISSTSRVEESREPEAVKPYYIVTEEEREMLATLVFLESSICSMDCQKAVASVIFNRLDSGKWRKDMNNDGEITLYDIVYYPNAFSPAYLIDSKEPNETAYAAVDYVIMNGPTVPTEVRYFRTSYDFKWDNYANYCVMDNVYFGYFTNWKQGAW